MSQVDSGDLALLGLSISLPLYTLSTHPLHTLYAFLHTPALILYWAILLSPVSPEPQQVSFAPYLISSELFPTVTPRQTPLLLLS